MTFDRRGILWDAINGKTPPSPAAALMGWTFRAVDPDAGTLEIGFALDERFTNPVGSIQGGFVAAMLDDTLGPALVAMLDPDQFAPTVSLNVQYLAPALPGEFVGYGRVVKRGGGRSPSSKDISSMPRARRWRRPPRRASSALCVESSPYELNRIHSAGTTTIERPGYSIRVKVAL